MLIDINSGNQITTVAHEKEFKAWKSKMSEEEFQAIVDHLNNAIDEKLENNAEVICVTELASPSWLGTPYMAIFEKSCDEDEEISALFFGSIAWYVFMKRDEKFGCGKYNFVQNRDIQGMTYFVLGQKR